MPNPTMRDARAAALAKPLPPTPVFASAAGSGPAIGPISGAAARNGLMAQSNLAKSPRPVSNAELGTAPADLSDSPQLAAKKAAVQNTLENRSAAINQQITAGSQ